MKLLNTLVFAAVSVGVGAGSVAVYDNFYWDKELRAQLAAKDKMITALNDDIEGLRDGLGTLEAKNRAALELLDSSGRDVAALAKNNQTAQEKLNAVIVRVVKLVSEMRAGLSQ